MITGLLAFTGSNMIRPLRPRQIRSSFHHRLVRMGNLALMVAIIVMVSSQVDSVSAHPVPPQTKKPDIKAGDEIRFKYKNQEIVGEVVEYKAIQEIIRIKYIDQRGREQTRAFRPSQIEIVKGAPAAAGKQGPRVWKSANGNFELTAILVGFDGNEANLKKADGKTIAVPADQLSKADQKYLEDYAAAGANGGGDSSAPGSSLIGRPVESRFLEPDMKSVQKIAFDKDSTTLKLVTSEVSAPTLTDEIIPLGKIPFFGKLQSLLFDHSGTKALVSYTDWKKSGGDEPPLVLGVVDLEKGKPLGQVGIDLEKTEPLDISPSGTKLLTITKDWKAPRLDIWEMSSGTPKHLVGWKLPKSKANDVFAKAKTDKKDDQKKDPSEMFKGFGENGPSAADIQKMMNDSEEMFNDMQESSNMGDQTINLARFVDDHHVVTINRSGGVYVWKLDPLKAVYQINTGARSYGFTQSFQLASNRKTLYTFTNGKVRGFDLLGGKHLGTKTIDKKFTPTGGIALSPSGSKMLIDDGSTFRIMAADGSIIDEYSKSLPPGYSAMQWLDDRFVAMPSSTSTLVFDTRYRIPVWKYLTMSSKSTFDRFGNTWMLWGGKNAIRLNRIKMPHQTAIDGLPADPKEFLVLKEGDRVRLEINGRIGGKQQILQSLAAKLKTRGVEVADDASIVLRASSQQNPAETTTYEISDHFGRTTGTQSVTTTSTTMRLDLYEDGQLVYTASATVGGAPPVLMLEDGQKASDVVPANAAPDDSFFTRFEFPKVIPRRVSPAKIGQSWVRDGKIQ